MLSDIKRTVVTKSLLGLLQSKLQHTKLHKEMTRYVLNILNEIEVWEFHSTGRQNINWLQWRSDERLTRKTLNISSTLRRNLCGTLSKSHTLIDSYIVRAKEDQKPKRNITEYVHKISPSMHTIRCKILAIITKENFLGRVREFIVI